MPTSQEFSLRKRGRIFAPIEAQSFHVVVVDNRVVVFRLNMHKHSLAILLLCLFLAPVFPVPVYAQSDQVATKDSSTIASIALASLLPVGMISGALTLNYLTFWRYANQVPWHWSNDPPYAMHIDKFAHFDLSAAGSDGMAWAYRSAGVKPETSVWLGAGIMFATGVLIEMEDARHGWSAEYGFSPGDATGDLLGSALPVLRYYYPFFNRLSTKLSLWPSDVLKQGAYKTIADDYESQFFWLSWDVHDVTPLPSWLNIALGFSAENLLPADFLPSRKGTTPYTDVYISPDINLAGIQIEGEFWRVFTSIMSYVRIPLPSLQFYPRFKFWWLR